MSDVTAEVFPQFSSGNRLPNQPEAAKEALCPGDFKTIDGVVHNRFGHITDWEAVERGLRLTCATSGCVNGLSHTHETPIFLMEPAEVTVPQMQVLIEVWEDAIFRVRYFTDEFKDPYQNLPAETRMLIGIPKESKYELTETDTELLLTTASCQLRIQKSDFRMQIFTRAGKPLFSQQKVDLFTSDVLPASLATMGGESTLFEAFTLDADEQIFGLGERFDGVARKGRSVDFWNKDAIGTTSPRTYINVPFYLSTKGYGLFLNTSAKTEWEVGTMDSAVLGFSVLDDQMDYFLLCDETPAHILAAYSRLTGFAALPPLWSFGLWMSRNSYTTWEIAEEVGDQMRAHDIPCDVLNLDTAWFAENFNCDLRFSKERFPEPEKHIKALLDKGFHISLWQYNYVPPHDNNINYREACERGYTAQDGQGGVYQNPADWTGSWVDDAVIDFSNPEARDWYGEQIENLIRMGAGAIKTDFGEGIPEQAHYHSIAGKYMHNLYPLLYNYTVYKATERASGEHIVWARSGTAGSQRFPLHWGGDSQCTFAALAGTLRAAISSGLSGLPFFSHDIGGFLGLPTPELYIRWAQVGLFSSHARCHGAGDQTYREPWKFGEEAEEIFRTYTKLRYSLMPYIYEQAERCTHTGLPMVRSLYLAYPSDRNVRAIEDQYLFGDDLLIAPVLKPLAETTVRTIYLPAGQWADFWTGEQIDSRGQWIDRAIDLAIMPIYVRQGAVLRFAAPVAHLTGGMGEIVETKTY